MLRDRLPDGGRTQVVRPDERRRADPVDRRGGREPRARGLGRLTEHPRTAVRTALPQPGEQHAAGEPVEVAGQPVERRQPAGVRQQPAEPPADRDDEHRHHDDRHPSGAAAARTGAAAAAREPEQGQQRQRDVEGHLGAEAPGLGEPGQQRHLAVDRRQRPGRPPVLRRAAQRRRHEDRDARERHQVRRDEPDEAAPEVDPLPDGGRRAAAGEHPRPHEQEPGQHEEDCHPDVAAGQPARPAAVVAGAALEPDVGEQDEDGGGGPVGLEDRQVVPRGGGGGGGGRRAVGGVGGGGAGVVGGVLPGQRSGGHGTLTTRAERTHRPASAAVAPIRTARAVPSAPTGSSTVCGPW